MDTALDFKTYYLEIPELLVSHYPDLNFQNHCYLRIALDNVIGTMWDTQIAKPAYKHLTTDQRKLVISYLSSYVKDKNLLLSHNMISLAYRGKLV